MGNMTGNTEVDSKELERTREMWHNFTNLIKYSTISAIVILALMAAFLL